MLRGDADIRPPDGSCSAPRPPLSRGMILPDLAAQHFLVLWLLFAGPRSAQKLRADLEQCNVRLSQSAFSQLMGRLERRRLVHAAYGSLRTPAGQAVRFRVYQATVSGARAWRRTGRFYGRFSDPGRIREHLFDDRGGDRDRGELAARLVELADAYLRAQP